MNTRGYSEHNLELRRDNYRIRLYNDSNRIFRVYNGMNLVHEGDDHGQAYRVYQQQL